MSINGHAKEGDTLAMFACPNPDCDRFNQFDAGNLSVVEQTGRDKAIRRLYCNHCGRRFSERRGSLMQDAKLPQETVVRIIKCLGHGCSLEATADICEVDARTVERLLRCAGRRAGDFHRLQLQHLRQPPEAVELDELHGRVCRPPRKRGRRVQPPRPGESRLGEGLIDAVAAWVETGFTRPWHRHRDS